MIRIITIILLIAISLLTGEEFSFSQADSIQQHLIRGYELLRQGQPENAIEEFKIVISAEPKNPNAYTGIGDSYFTMAEFQPAIDYYKRALEIVPKSAILYRNLGMAYSYLGDDESAVKHWKKASDLDPTMKLLHYNIGYYYYLKEEYKKAIEEFKKELKVNSTDAPSYFYIARSYAALNDEENTMKYFDEYLKYETDPVRLAENKEKIQLIKKVLEEVRKRGSDQDKIGKGEGKNK